MREPVLDTVERVSEMCFGLFMALTFVGAVNAVGEEKQTGIVMFYTALGCNLAWGLVDAVMYLVRTITMRGKQLTLALAVRRAPDEAAARRALHEGLPPVLAGLLTDADLESMRERLMTTSLPERPRLHGGDFAGAFAIFLIVVATTFPVALPFVLIADPKTGLLVSRILTLVMLFGGGLALGRFAGYGTWRAGLAFVALGVVLTAAIIALGG
jgi:VIT1/CCC1 family predicted Fe2+/Mn2+ transporter